MSAETLGFCEPAFAPVAQAFARGFEERGEVGAAVAVHLNGRLVVDLWGGLADPIDGRPWEADTIAHAHSVSKPFVAACALVLAEHGQLDLDAPVADYWPEYGQPGRNLRSSVTSSPTRAGCSPSGIRSHPPRSSTGSA